MAAHKMNMLRVWPAFVAKCFWALCFTQHLVPHSAGNPYTEHFTQWATCFFQHYPSFDSRCCQNLSVSHLSQVLLMENVAFSLCVCVGLGGGVVFAQLFLFVLVLVRSRSFCSVWLFVLVRFSVGFILVVCACVVLGGGGGVILTVWRFLWYLHGCPPFDGVGGLPEKTHAFFAFFDRKLAQNTLPSI